MARGPLSVGQLYWVSILAMFPTIVLLLPGDLLREGGRSGWWTPLAAAGPAMLVAWAVGTMAGAAGTPDQAARSTWGPWAARVLSAVAWLAMGVYTVTATGEFAQLAQGTYVLENVPVAVLTGLGLAAAAMAAWLGLTVIARSGQAMLPLLLAVYLILLAATLPFAHLLWALPLWPRNAAFAHLQPLGRTWVWLMEPSFLALAADEFDPAARRAMRLALPVAVLVGAALLSLTVWVLVADFGPARAAQFVMPVFDAAREATFGSFIEHMEALYIPVVLLGGTGKLALFYWLWTRTGRVMTGGGAGLWLVVTVLCGGAASLLLFKTAVDLDLQLYAMTARYALPAMVTAILLPYGAAAARRRVMRA